MTASAASDPGDNGVRAPKRAGARAAWLAVAVITLARCSSSPSFGTGVGGTQGGGQPDAGLAAGAGGGGGAGGDASGGGPSDGGVDAALEGGGGQTDAGTDAAMSGPPPPPPTCNPGTTWGPGVLIAVSTAMDDELSAVTPDELTMVWIAGSGGTAQLLVADRTSTGSAFGSPQSVPAGAFSLDRVGVSPDGLRLVVINAGGQGLSELVRASRGDTFGAPGAGAFGNFQGALSSGLSYGDPVVGADDSVFYYSVFGAGQTMTVYRAARLLSTDAWPSGAPLRATSDLAPQGALRRRPTGISSDEQTLYFWDEVSGTERAAWINVSTGVYDSFMDLDARAFAAPNASCSALYYSAQGSSSEDLFVASP